MAGHIETEIRLKKILYEVLGQSHTSLTDTIIGDLGADSLDIVEIMILIEERFGIDQLDEARYAQAKTVGDLINLINQSQQPEAA